MDAGRASTQGTLYRINLLKLPRYTRQVLISTYTRNVVNLKNAKPNASEPNVGPVFRVGVKELLTLSSRFIYLSSIHFYNNTFKHSATVCYNIFPRRSFIIRLKKI